MGWAGLGGGGGSRVDPIKIKRYCTKQAIRTTHLSVQIQLGLKLNVFHRLIAVRANKCINHGPGDRQPGVRSLDPQPRNTQSVEAARRDANTAVSALYR